VARVFDAIKIIERPDLRSGAIHQRLIQQAPTRAALPWPGYLLTIPCDSHNARRCRMDTNARAIVRCDSPMEKRSLSLTYVTHRLPGCRDLSRLLLARVKPASGRSCQREPRFRT